MPAESHRKEGQHSSNHTSMIRIAGKKASKTVLEKFSTKQTQGLNSKRLSKNNLRDASNLDIKVDEYSGPNTAQKPKQQFSPTPSRRLSKFKNLVEGVTLISRNSQIQIKAAYKTATSRFMMKNKTLASTQFLSSKNFESITSLRPSVKYA